MYFGYFTKPETWFRRRVRDFISIRPGLVLLLSLIILIGERWYYSLHRILAPLLLCFLTVAQLVWQLSVFFELQSRTATNSLHDSLRTQQVTQSSVFVKAIQSSLLKIGLQLIAQTLFICLRQSKGFQPSATNSRLTVSHLTSSSAKELTTLSAATHQLRVHPLS